MPAVTPDLGHGTTITFESGFISRILSVSISGVSRAAVDTTNFGTDGGKTFMPSDTYDPGEISVTMQHDSDVTPPITAAPGNVTVTFPDAETLTGTGFLTGYEISMADEDVTEATATIKLTGNITW